MPEIFHKRVASVNVDPFPSGKEANRFVLRQRSKGLNASLIEPLGTPTQRAFDKGRSSIDGG